MHTLNKEHIDLAKELITRKMEMAHLQDQNDVLSQKVTDLTKIVDSQAKEVEEQFKGEIENAVYHFEAALEIAFSFDWHHELFSIHLSLAALSFGERRFDDANVHAERIQPRPRDEDAGFGLVRAGQVRRSEVRGSARHRSF